MRLVRSHRRDPDDVATSDKTEQEEETDEVLGPSRDWRRGGENDHPPTIVERGGEPRHVPDHALSLDGRVSPRGVLERCETHLHAAGIIDGPYLRYLSSGNRKGGFELRQRFQSIVKSTVDMRDIDVDGPVCPSDVPLITRLKELANEREADPILLECLHRLA